MASGYPSSLDSFSTAHADGTEVIEAATINDLADATNKIEAELGIDPKGTYTDVAARLATLETVPSNLSATAPDKLVWKDADGTVDVELFGQLTPAGYALADTEDFATDPSSRWTWESGSVNWDVGSQAISMANASEYAYRADWGPFSDTAQVFADFLVGGPDPANDTIGKFELGFETGSGGRLSVLFLRSGTPWNVRFSYMLSSADFGDWQDVSLNWTPPYNVWMRLTVTRQGNDVEYELKRNDTDEVLHSGTFTLPANQGTFGTGVSLPRVFFGGQVGSGSTLNVDNVSVNTVQPEAHDLFAAITSPNGTRQVKRLIGSSGPSAFRSDFVQPGDLTAALMPLATTAYVDAADAGVGAPNTQVADYTLALADAGKAVEMSAAGALTLTVPPDSAVAFPVGTIIEVARTGAGAVTIAQGAGVVLRNKIEAAGTTSRTIANQWSSVTLRKRASDEWVLVGDIA